eukprot:1918130-Rhodomonas_salina.6
MREIVLFCSGSYGYPIGIVRHCVEYRRFSARGGGTNLIRNGASKPPLYAQAIAPYALGQYTLAIAPYVLGTVTQVVQYNWVTPQSALGHARDEARANINPRSRALKMQQKQSSARAPYAQGHMRQVKARPRQMQKRAARLQPPRIQPICCPYGCRSPAKRRSSASRQHNSCSANAQTVSGVPRCVDWLCRSVDRQVSTLFPYQTRLRHVRAGTRKVILPPATARSTAVAPGSGTRHFSTGDRISGA